MQNDILQDVMNAVGCKWPILEHWLKQEAQRVDSCDFYTQDTAENEDIISRACAVLYNRVDSVTHSVEPYRATLDFLTELTQR